MTDRTCEVDGCNTRHYGRGMCVKHWTRWRKFGDAETVKRVVGRTGCLVDGCDREHVALGYCKRHHRALKKHGDPLHRVQRSGPGGSHFKGGRMVTNEGYVRVKVYEDDPMFVMADGAGYVPEHRLVMAEALGRPLTRRETVHHINTLRADNRLENLQLRIGSHGVGGVFSCRTCGSRDIVAEQLP